MYSYLLTVIHQKCPRCREGKLFTDQNPYHLGHLFKMKEKCPVCGQITEIEPGFYYGTSYVSYALTVAFSVTTFIAWWVLIGISLDDNRLFWWLGLNVVSMILLQPYLMRLSRIIWLSFFVKYNSHWLEDNV